MGFTDLMKTASLRFQAEGGVRGTSGLLDKDLIQLLNEDIHIIAMNHRSLFKGLTGGVGAEQAVHAHIVEHLHHVLKGFFRAGTEHFADGHILMNHLDYLFLQLHAAAV